MPLNNKCPACRTERPHTARERARYHAGSEPPESPKSAYKILMESKRREQDQTEREKRIGRGPIRDEEAEDFEEPYEIGE